MRGPSEPREGLWVKPVPSLLGALAAFLVAMSRRPRLAGLPSELEKIVGKAEVIQRGESFEEHRRDMADYEGTPAVVVRPESEEQVSAIVQLANRRGVPVLAWGAGSSLTGAVVRDGAIVVDMKRFDRILKVDPVNWYVDVQPGVVLDDLEHALQAEGFFFPPDPASSFLCTVGGAIATGAGGMRCVRYGTMKDWVMALRVVLPTGEVTSLGEPLPKNRAGYDLVHLFVGSEGTLGIITRATLKILPLPVVRVQRMLVQFADWPTAGEAIKGLRKARVVPDLLEFLDRETIIAVNQSYDFQVEEAEATLLVDLEEPSIPAATEVFRAHSALAIRPAADEVEADRLYQVRARAYLALKERSSGIQIEDVVVPIDRLAEYLRLVKEVAARHRVQIPVVGHAGDGNVHPAIVYDKADAKSRDAATAAFEEICRYAIRVGGSVTGEHGVGSQKVALFRAQLEAHGGGESLRLMKEIKRVFDPKGIMNPGKYVDAA
ncbi:MAG: FAD-binding oxidoreductase [Methanobacteriota archaeon]|nr:MAG: FAD-binding oxidoreductase [Euryarchaeota archaeon]